VSGPYEQAAAETKRLQSELDITNVDHIALWLEANKDNSTLGWLACRIIEAHEQEMALAALPNTDPAVEKVIEQLETIANEGCCAADDPVRRSAALLRTLSAENTALKEALRGFVAGSIDVSGTALIYEVDPLQLIENGMTALEDQATARERG
jgi:hypothetical protein